MIWYVPTCTVSVYIIYIHTDIIYVRMASDVNVYALLCVCRCIHTDPNNTHTMPLSPLDVQVSLSGFPTFPGPGRALEGRRLGMGCFFQVIWDFLGNLSVFNSWPVMRFLIYRYS